MKTDSVPAPVSIGQAINDLQVRQAKIKARLAVIDEESARLEAELASIQTKHFALVREFDAKSALP